ncbi:MAG: hypothetical protein KGY76_06340 [Candidatus Thermoplasmatota archaeon]|nr:hypothetical protein [Candidatus Thermoplasmatota archaeon]
MGFIASLLENSLLMLSVAVLVGILLGRLEFKGFRFGISGALFAGLVLGHFGVSVPHSYFTISLAIFIAAVGLMAAKDIGGVVKAHGFKFVVTGFFMTAVAALLTFIGAKTLGTMGVVDPRYIEGVFSGALTSSPGLGAHIEGVSTAVREKITIGHSLAYPFGVIMVILFQELWPKIRDIDLEEEKLKFKKRIEGAKSDKGKELTKEDVTFSVGGFVLAVVLGGLLGEIPIPLGPLGSVKLGITGGILPAALAVGYVGKIGPINTRMSHEVLSSIRSLTLALFLAVVGINGGAGFAEAVMSAGAVLVAITLLVGLGTIAAGMLLLRGLWDLDWIIASGAITGGMTSTPGLGAAIEATGTEDVGGGYGSTYPFALLGMVIFAKLLSILIV